MSQTNNLCEREQLFQSLLTQAKKKGFLTMETITKRYAKYHLTEEELEDLYNEFEDKDVYIVFEEPEDDMPEEPTTLRELNSAEYTDDPIKVYLDDIHNFPLLTHKETLELVRKMANGDEEARDYLICCNLKYAFSVAKKYNNTGVPFEDLIQQANLGLMDAVDRYNPNRGTKFSTYAMFWIRNAICLYISGHSKTIKLPGFITSDLAKIKNFRDSYFATHQTYPTDDEIATGIGYTIARIKRLKAFEFNIISTEAQPNEDMDGTVLDTLSSEVEETEPLKKFMQEDLRKALDAFLQRLPERERKILMMRYGLYDGRPMSLEEIGKEVDLTNERVRQLESRALTRIRKMPGITGLYDYLY